LCSLSNIGAFICSFFVLTHRHFGSDARRSINITASQIRPSLFPPMRTSSIRRFALHNRRDLWARCATETTASRNSDNVWQSVATRTDQNDLAAAWRYSLTRARLVSQSPTPVGRAMAGDDLILGCILRACLSGIRHVAAHCAHRIVAVVYR
jgi:hypothetical protein